MSNAQIAAAFYEAFRRKDFKTMQSLYADKVVFNDPVFQNLHVSEVRAMWEMLISRGKDMSVDYLIGEEKGNEVAARWTAGYTFSGTGRKVVNHIDTTLVIEHGKIISHTDDFNFAKWAKQALGWKGLIFGNTSFLKNRIRSAAMNNLKAFIAKQKNNNPL